jgi:hypothetical protein
MEAELAAYRERANKALNIAKEQLLKAKAEAKEQVEAGYDVC